MQTCKPIIIILSFTGDEILSVNGQALQGLRHNDAIQLFKSFKSGDMLILLGRRLPKTVASPTETA